jgi:hypothetical protein
MVCVGAMFMLLPIAEPELLVFLRTAVLKESSDLDLNIGTPVFFGVVPMMRVQQYAETARHFR